mgnify:CR=1 FL=1
MSLKLKLKKKTKFLKTKNSKFKSSSDEIKKKFITVEDAILKYSFQDALINNQKLILDTLLDIRDCLT